MCVNGIPAMEVMVDSAVSIKEMFSMERKQLLQHHGSCTGKERNPLPLLAHSCWGINVYKLRCVYSLTHLNFSDFEGANHKNKLFEHGKLCRNYYYYKRIVVHFLNRGISKHIFYLDLY